MLQPNFHPALPQRISPPDYQFVRRTLRDRMGYDLGEGKEYLVETRLAPVAAARGMDHLGEIIAHLRRNDDQALWQAVFDAMSIKETSFFRSPTMFGTLTHVILPALMQTRANVRRLRFWCAGCSTGQEAYSIAITLADHFPQLASWRVELLATDISERALEQARQGTYSQLEVQRGLPVPTLRQHFQLQDDSWCIAETLRRRIEFRKHNLLDSFVFLNPPFDIIFLRNVLIYFDNTAKSSLFSRLRQAVSADGYLILGETESVLGLTDLFSLHHDQRNFFRPA